ncbi:ervatamin-B [Sorghum bicolor]|uniref:Uncharacterized protein n=1 Tax=Sorghum bicolor TaxID=4558 RepID=C5X409_SORBI|nr:ervatamin-B [Sorghum bicolor]EER97645.1 hypothetical protein SORBI_3002G397100 [Sorghum bicolor]|eukprot:XP_002461124.1 ervatamin-B [Sorghum bicolor]
MVKVQRMGGVVLAAAVLLVAMVAMAAAELVPVMDKDLESEASMMNLYQRWRSVYNGSLDHVEKPSRFDTFKENARHINEFNKRENESYKLGLNQFSDLTDEEFDSGMYTGALLEDTGNVSLSSGMIDDDDDDELLASAANKKVPCKWDWRRHGAVTPVKNQKKCWSCWVFGMVGAVEGINAIKTGKLKSLSEQEVLDCSGAGTCKGGDPYKAFDHAKRPGLALDHQGHPPYYPAYVAEKKKCRFNPRKHVVKIDGKRMMRDTTEAKLKCRVYKQPVAILIEANHAFSRYSKGVFTGPCGTRLNHVVVVVGYGTTANGIDYWIVKNSWGKGWGENGYIRMKRHVRSKAGLCGMYMRPMYPIKN